MVNNAHIIRQLARQLEDPEPDPSATMSAPMRERLHPEPCMIVRLPTTGRCLPSSAGVLRADGFLNPQLSSNARQRRWRRKRSPGS